jgi:tetratricopeptide (TPR) repeat protein
MVKILCCLIFLLLIIGCGVFKKTAATEPLSTEESEIVGEYYVQTGIDSFEHEKFDAAISQWKRALEYLPDDAEIYNFMGIAYHRISELDSSIILYEQAVSLDPEYYQAINNTGYIYFLKGEYDAALKNFNRALEVNPYYEQAGMNRVKCIEIMEGLLPVNAFELFERAEKIDSLELKIENYRRALAIDSNYVDSWNNLGVSYHYYGYLDSAVYCLQNALEKNPKHPQANNNMAFLLDAAGNYEAAIYHYQTAIRAKPDYVVAMINLGDTYLHANDYLSARTIWETALKLYPDDAGIRERLNDLTEIEEAGGLR